MFLVGKIIGTHGLKGELKVKADSSFKRFEVGKTIYLQIDDKYLPFKVSSNRLHKENNLITINNLTDINLVSMYIGKQIYATHNYEELAEDEYYYEDLIGKIVFSTNNEKIGEVVDVREVPQGLLLEVSYQDKIVLIPFVKEFIKKIDQTTIEIEVIEGLL